MVYRSRFYLSYATIAAVLLALTVASLSIDVSAKTLRWSSKGDATTQDPHGQDESFTKSINALVYERLLQPGRDMKPVAWLAASWKNVSPTKRVVTLRRGVKFHDGSLMTADDVVFSFQRAAKSKPIPPPQARLKKLTTTLLSSQLRPPIHLR
jgi:peptide/nickel transport system substrate-binding protein